MRLGRTTTASLLVGTLVGLCFVALPTFGATDDQYIGDETDPSPATTMMPALKGEHLAWSYADENSWASEYPECRAKGFRQSPIDIVTDAVVFRPRMRLEFVDFDQEVEFEFKNTHHSVSLRPLATGSIPTVRLNWVEASDFELQEIHFHWGDGINKGSEHEINDQRAAAEMHMVHYRKGLNKSEIGTTEDSVVVVGVLIESDQIEHNKLESLIKRVERVNGTDDEYVDDTPENLINMLPDSHHSFYTYKGSLTTPPCYEVVTWIIMSEPVYMEQQRLVELSNLEAARPGGRKKIASNHRSIQPLLNRPVYTSFNATDSITPQLRKSTRFFDNGRFADAFNEYWRRVTGIRGYMKRALLAIEAARRDLLHRLGRQA